MTRRTREIKGKTQPVWWCGDCIKVHMGDKAAPTCSLCQSVMQKIGKVEVVE